MAIKVKSVLQTSVGLNLQNLILSICGVYKTQKNLVTSTVYYFVNRETGPVKTEELSCVIDINDHPAHCLYNALKIKLQERGVLLSDIEDC